MDNNKTPKIIVKKRRLNIKRVFILALVIAGIVFLIFQVFKFKIGNISVSGNKFVSDSEIIKLSNILNKRYLTVTSRGACKNIMKNEFINTCEIKKVWWLKINIIVSENKPLFMYKETEKIILSNNQQIDIKNIYGVPTLINYVPQKVLDKFVSGLKEVDNDIIQSISEIEYSPSQNSDGSYIDEERFMMTMNDGNIVYINNRNIKVLNKYEKIYASIGNKKGYFNFDADFSNYYFKEFSSKE